MLTLRYIRLVIGCIFYNTDESCCYSRFIGVESTNWTYWFGFDGNWQIDIYVPMTDTPMAQNCSFLFANPVGPIIEAITFADCGNPLGFYQ